METAARRQRDLRQRETLFLDRARKFLLSHGYHGLTMDRIAQATGYSRGTIYQHFRSKEDIIVALINRGMAQRLSMIERAAGFQGRTRERMQAVGEAVDLFMRLYRDDARVAYLGNAEAVMQKASEASLNTMKGLLHQTTAIATGIVREAIEVGDLTLKPPATPEILIFNLWAITEEGQPLDRVAGITGVAVEAGVVKVGVVSGSYRFEVQG